MYAYAYFLYVLSILILITIIVITVTTIPSPEALVPALDPDEPGLEPSHLGHRKHTTHAHGTRFDYVGAPEKATKQYARDDDERYCPEAVQQGTALGAPGKKGQVTVGELCGT